MKDVFQRFRRLPSAKSDRETRSELDRGLADGPGIGHLIFVADRPSDPLSGIAPGLYVVVRHAGSGYLVGSPASEGELVMIPPGSIAATWAPTAKYGGF